MKTKKWYEVIGEGQYSEDGKILLAKVNGYSNALEVAETFKRIGYNNVEVK